MLRKSVARIGLTLAAVAALSAVTPNAATAAPRSFSAKVVHAGGQGATAATASGKISWSASLKTVTLSDVRLWVKGGECIHFSFDGYQGGTIVADADYPNTGDYCPIGDVFYGIGTVSLTADRTGGISEADVHIYDSHQITGYAWCGQRAATCSSGQF
jgi:hypothetical protein